MNTPLNQRVLDAVLTLGECTTRQIVAVVGRYVSATTVNKYVRAIQRYELNRSKTRKTIVSKQSALRQRVGDAIKVLVKRGRVRRVRRGVYAPPLPTIYLSEERSA